MFDQGTKDFQWRKDCLFSKQFDNRNLSFPIEKTGDMLTLAQCLYFGFMVER